MEFRDIKMLAKCLTIPVSMIEWKLGSVFFFCLKPMPLPF